MASIAKFDQWQNSAGVAYGTVLQVKQTLKTDYFSTASTSWVDWTGVTLTITPTSASSKFFVSLTSSVSNDSSNSFQYVRLLRNGSVIAQGDAVGSAQRCWIDAAIGSLSTYHTAGKTLAGTFLDSPAATSAITYSVQVVRTANGTSYWGRPADVGDGNRGGVPTVLTVMEIAA